MRMIFIYHAHDFCAALRQKGRNTAYTKALQRVGKKGENGP